MTNIAKIINQKAKEEFPYSQPLADFVSVNERQSHRRQGFKIGAAIATSAPSVLTELLGKFAEWLSNGGYHNNGNGAWLKIGKSRSILYTTEELISKYIQETIKPKEDENETNKA